ncbi:cytochrome c oxidase accessory protein CcoG [Rhizobium sp. KVB221]|uniref:Cytochrome c oxidase accessory protein CcoG n=1 Tax=Rhizobium setariae TaxID=2801340 RepID=A0A936YPE1_9HYPH|nr:cytochrome c oxidase accessory protein CcoG [Rhizobium setariae]MBL0373218.1 cytochrome c oxidase accessory protein CcoG [Rhizobium setariae]
MGLHENLAKTDGSDIERLDASPVNSAKVRQPLYAPRKKIHPKRAEGKFRQFKWIVMAITLGIYYLAPWIRWDRGDHVPNQAILLDVADRRFYFFFIEIWPQEFYFVAGLLIMAGLGLFLVTSAVGRAWCGYTCPQTVWVDLFLVVERAIEGDRNARIKLDSTPWTPDKIVKRVSKHAIWLLIGVLTGGAWIFYFADAPTLLHDLVTFHAPAIAYLTVAILTATTYVFGGLMREQVCTYMCPWPRIQGAMLDENSLVVTYNDWRGEPRSRHAKKVAAAGETVGDCVDCNACVAVCPMGIDIRDGLQMECITCALCIDACDGVMDKVGHEKGLIGYSTLSDYTHNMLLATADYTVPINPALVRGTDGGFDKNVRHFRWQVIFRPRIILYTVLWSLVGIGLLVALGIRDRLQLDVLHDRNPQFVMESDGSIRNGYTIKILNMRPEPRRFVLSVRDLPGATMTIAGETWSQGRFFGVDVEADAVKTMKIYVTVPKAELPAANREFTFHVEYPQTGESHKYKSSFIVPEKKR